MTRTVTGRNKFKGGGKGKSLTEVNDYAVHEMIDDTTVALKEKDLHEIAHAKPSGNPPLN